MKKTCQTCKEHKLYDEFHKSKHGKLGRHQDCKICRSKKNKLLNYKKPTLGSFKCNLCLVILDVTKFHKDKTSTRGIQSYCIECSKIKTINYYSKDCENKFWTKLYKDLKRNAKTRNIEIHEDITKKYLVELFKTQNGNCNLTNISMTTEFIPYKGRNKRIYNSSVDRIDSKKGYTIENIQLVCSIVNTMKWDLDNNDFIDICHKVLKKSEYI